MSPPSDRLTLLLVDDDDVDRMAVRRALSAGRLPVSLTEVEDAPAALNRVASAERFDCLLLDLRLPTMNGLELMKALREAGSDVPIIVLTGHGDEETAVEIMKAGASDYVSKASLSSERLCQSIKNAVRVHRAERDARSAQASLTRYSEQLRLLARASADANAKLSVEAVSRTLADHARVIFGARRASVRLLSSGAAPETRTVSAADDAPADDPPAVDPTTIQDSLRAPGFLAAPLRGRGVLPLGLLELSGKVDPSGRGDGDFTEADEAVLVQLAQVGSVAIGNALLYESAQAATRARDDMMAVVSHDLRNPLNTIMLSAEILARRGASSTDPSPIAQRIRRSAERMDHLISDLLDVTRIESGLLGIEPKAHPVARITDDVLDLFRPMAAEKSVGLERQVSSDLVVHADPERIFQVLGNLIGNSLKFTPGGGRVTLGAERDGDWVKVSVADTGTGIHPEHLPRLFDRHWQARGEAKQGTGLGLFIAKGIVAAHGGRIWADSSGAGTTFYFTLPSA